MLTKLQAGLIDFAKEDWTPEEVLGAFVALVQVCSDEQLRDALDTETELIDDLS